MCNALHMNGLHMCNGFQITHVCNAGLHMCNALHKLTMCNTVCYTREKIVEHLTSGASLLVRSGDPHGPDATCIHVHVHVGYASAPPAPLPPRNAHEACGMAGESGSGPERRRLKGAMCQVLV
jgi:hypothetical protein